MNNKKVRTCNILMTSSVFILCFLGLVFIYSASSYSAKSTYNDGFFFVKKQAIGIIIGTVFFILTSKIDYGFYKRINIPLAIVTVILLCLCLIDGIGVENYGAKRWINLGTFTIQPSEIAKFSLILFCSTYFSKFPERCNSVFKVLPVFGYGILICLLVIIEPNMSITVCLITLLFSMIFVSGIKIKHLLALVVPAILLAVILVLSEPYRLRRLFAFIDPWKNPKGEGYQLLQSLYGLGSGGLFGVGLFNSRQKFAFLPFSESDFILSIIGEETGFTGLVFLLALYMIIIFNGLRIAKNAKDFFGFSMAVGISMIIGIQTVVNVLVVSGSIPPTGLPLPLLSSGNTSIIIFMGELGILLNISKKSL